MAIERPSIRGLAAALLGVRPPPDLQTRLDAEVRARVNLQARLAAHEQAHADLYVELHAERAMRAALQAERDDWAEQARVRGVHLDEARRTLADVQAALDRESAACAALQARLADVTDLHQSVLGRLQHAQAELERHRQATAEPITERSLAFGATASALLSCESAYVVDGLAVDAERSTGQDVAWIVRGLTVHRRLLPELRVRTRVQQGVAHIGIDRIDAAAPLPLLRWPVSAPSADALWLGPPTGADDAEPTRLAVLQQLSASDWTLLQVLPRLLTDALEAGSVTLPPPHDRRAFVQALGRSRQMVARTPPVLRFDGVDLFGQQSVQGRAVLGVRLIELALPGRRLPRFDFQLQSALQDGRLTDPAYLIVGEDTAGAPLEQWLPNARAATGDAMMGIELSPRGPTAGPWNALGLPDRAFFTALVDLLPLLFVALQSNGSKAELGWPSWMQLAVTLRDWVRVPPERAAAPPSTGGVT